MFTSLNHYIWIRSFILSACLSFTFFILVTSECSSTFHLVSQSVTVCQKLDRLPLSSPPTHFHLSAQCECPREKHRDKAGGEAEGNGVGMCDSKPSDSPTLSVHLYLWLMVLLNNCITHHKHLWIIFFKSISLSDEVQAIRQSMESM